MANKTFLEIFYKYSPNDTVRRILDSSSDIKMRADKERRMIEVSLKFPKTIDKDMLYGIEREIAAKYELNSVRLLPNYAPDLLEYDYIPQILIETERTGIVARGFFSNYKYDFDGKTLEIKLPFVQSGIELLDNARTPKVIEDIIKSEFGVQCNVNIIHTDEIKVNNDAVRRTLEEYDKKIAIADANYNPNAYSSRDEYRGFSSVSDDEDTVILPRVASLFSGNGQAFFENGVCTIGHAKFDISSPEYSFGDVFEITPCSIASIEHPVKNIVLVGEVFNFLKESTRSGDKFNITFGLTDGYSSIDVKCYSLEPDEAGEISSFVKDGVAVAMRGYAKKEIRKGKMDEDFSFFFNSIAKISRIKRKDNAEKKRVELHLHTTMSTMDALIDPSVAVKTAHDWGHPAIAITDHGNVQAYQSAMLAAEKLSQKVIYGVEAYFVNDTASSVYGKTTPTDRFDDEMIVFDIETTGLSPITCKITEIGAVKIKGGEILEEFNTFVDPECHIPEEITSLTSITDEMVAGAPKVDEALKMFFDFIGDTDARKHYLVAHNANFDVSFIRTAAENCNMDFDNPYIDTVAVSRFINPSLKNHKLDTLANHYKLGDFNHHRACDDARVLAEIYFRMVEDMKEHDIQRIDELKQEMSLKSDPLKLKTYHQIILVKDSVGLKNLYKLISYSYLNYFRKHPRIPKTMLERHREGLIIGSACEAGELFQAILENRPEREIEEIVNFYDYLEIQPISNNRFLIDDGKVADEEGLRNLNRRIVALGEKYNKPVVATCDAHFLNEEDELYRKIILSGMKFKDADRDTGIYLRTTEEMLKEFEYLGKEKAEEVVITNTNMIEQMISGDIRPFPKGTFTPELEGAEEDLQRICYEKAYSMYGNPLPEIVATRLDKELTSIIKNGFAVLYMIAQKLVQYSESQGYLVGSRGSVGSSFVASAAGISEVNPLPPHYWCPKCQYSDFSNPTHAGSGFDLPDKNCPVCGTLMNNDGHDIPFETFLGFYGDKSPDIDLNFSGDVQGRVHKYTEELFGAENVFRAGTIGTLADKTAYGFIAKYLEERGKSVSRAEMNRLVTRCVGVKRNTGQHPGGIVVVPKKYEIYDFCPVQHPADDPNSNIVTTHFTFEYLHDTLLKLDELGHDIPTKYKYLEKFTNTSVLDVKMNDRSVYDLFLSTKPLGVEPEDIDCPLGTLGLPELGTRFVIKMLEDCKPQSFSDLLQISGLSHGTDVWTGNAQDLINQKICTISEVIGTRDSIMLVLIKYGVEKSHAFKIMEMVRKGKGLTPEYEAEMREANVPEWYIASCKKIKYMFPKAHAAAYDMSAIRMGWYKVHYPIAFYCTMFTVAPAGFDAEIVMKGKKYVSNLIKDIEKRGKEATKKEQDMVPTLQLVNEAYARGMRFLPIDIEKSESFIFKPENNSKTDIRMPFSALPGLGENAAQKIIAAREEEPFFSVDDLQTRAKLSKSIIEILRRNGVLDNVNETDQLSFF